MLLNVRRKNGSFILIALCWIFAITAQTANAERITRVSGIRDGETVTGELRIQTQVADLVDGEEYTVWYDIQGPTSYQFFDDKAPFVLNERYREWSTGDAEPGNYKLNVYLIRNKRILDFRYIDFNIGSNLKVSRIIGINRNVTLTRDTAVEAKVRGGTPSKVVFDIKGPVNIKHTDYESPYFLIGDEVKWDVHGVPAGDYEISVTAYSGDTAVDTRTLPFHIESDIRIRSIQGIDRGSVLRAPTQIEADVIGGTPSKVVFKLTGPENVYDVETQAPYVMFGEGNTFDPANYPPGRYILRVSAYSGEELTNSRRISFRIPNLNNEPNPQPDPDDDDGDDTGTAPKPRSKNFLGMNLADVTYYTREWVFVDAMKQSHRWLPTHPGDSDPWDSGESLQLNESGWPLLRNGQAAHTIMYHDTRGSYPAGRYVCTWEGDGDVDLGWDAKVIRKNGNRIIAEVTPTDLGIYLRIDRSNRNDPVRNVKVWLPGFEDAQSPFHPLYLKRLKPFSVIRFMDWMQTNGSNITTWSDRPRYDYYTQGTGDGVALEYMIDLCNELGADPWFCMPHLANDRYVENFAKLVKSRLRKDLNVYVEWSNEVWNSQFPQHKWIQSRTDGRSLSDAFNEAWAEEADRDFEIWMDVWGNQSGRVIRVAAGQKDNPWVTGQLVENLQGEFDAISCTTYFGMTKREMDSFGNVTPRRLLEKAMDDMVKGQRTNYRAHGQLSRQWTRKTGRDIPLIGYEGGQHYTAEGGNPSYLNALLDMQNHPLMYDVYIANMREWENAGGSLFTAFNFVEKPDKWGAWGQLDFMDQAISTAPKYRALLDYKTGN